MGTFARIVVAEDDYLVREGIRALMTECGYELCAVVEDLDALLAAVDEHRPDVVLTDIRMPPTHSDEGVRAAKDIRSRHPATGVVVLSQYVEPEYALALFEGGTAGLAYLLKERVGNVVELSAAIDAVRSGESAIDRRVVEALVAGRRGRRSKLDRLSDRELEVLEQLASGRSNTAIAAIVHLSERAVEKNINSIFMKLDLLPERETNRRVLAVLCYLGDLKL